MVEKITYWRCNQGHQHPTRAEAEVCDLPYTGDEIVQGMLFKIGDKFVSDALQALSYSGYRTDRKVTRRNPQTLPIWVVTGMAIVTTNTRPGSKYRFERAIYTLVSSDDLVKKVRGRQLLTLWTRVENTRRSLLAHFRSYGWKELTPELVNEINEVVGVVIEKAESFNPHLKETGD
jgi:hypothetical protein